MYEQIKTINKKKIVIMCDLFVDVLKQIQTQCIGGG